MTALGAERSHLAAVLERYRASRAESISTCRRELALNDLDVQALLLIEKDPGIRPSTLREHLGITSAGVTTLVDRLVQREILRREVDANDRRVNHIYTTIDMGSEPWNGLTRFDLSFEENVARYPAELQSELAALLDESTTAALASSGR